MRSHSIFASRGGPDRVGGSEHLRDAIEYRFLASGQEYAVAIVKP